MILVTIEGIYENGKIELAGCPPGVDRARVLVTFLPSEASQKRPMTYGQFRGDGMSTEEDFKIAEWHEKAEGEDAD
jgi:hypothetical protein